MGEEAGGAGLHVISNITHIKSEGMDKGGDMLYNYNVVNHNL